MKKQGGFAEVDGTHLYYEVAGSGHPMILIHGFTLDSRMWDDQFVYFAQRYQVIRYDLRGFGKSSLPISESYSYADDLKALIDYLGVSHAYVIGLSLGGMIAIDFALEYPEATDALVAADAALGGFQWQEFESSLDSVWTCATESGAQAGKEVWQNIDLFKPAFGNPKVASRLALMFSDYSGWHFVNDDPASELDPPANQRLNDICVPVLVIVGEYDTPDFHSISNILHEEISDSRKVVIPGVGHMSNMEGSDRFNEIVLDFLVNL